MISFLIKVLMIFSLGTCAGTYYSQSGQDKFVYENYFKGSSSGIFVDIGAHDGITYSNSFFFEKDLGWKGICIEPLPEIFAKLKKNRSCLCIQGCIANKAGEGILLKVWNAKSSNPNQHIEMLSGLQDKYDSRHLQRIHREVNNCSGNIENIKVSCFLLNDILEQNEITKVNFLSIDTEGNEFDIASSINFEKYKIDVIAVEDNYGDSRMIPFFKEKGFTYVTKLEGDLIFVRNDFRAL